MGAWLVLDDATLCPLSVLDRLSALLEPGGAPALDEGGAVGGDHRVAPALCFRVFLAVGRPSAATSSRRGAPGRRARGPALATLDDAADSPPRRSSRARSAAAPRR
ncbi:ATPase [Aureococcus anophagefferens]|nr:ATPase [Aureococcus anophagefferens]